ncbi:zincin [Backusella circina FSU 941]|nr:zincin [Backusella circina FSU 941]
MHRLTRQAVVQQLNRPNTLIRKGILQRSITTAFRLAPPKVATKVFTLQSRHLSTQHVFHRRMATVAAHDYKDIPFLKWHLFPNFEYLLTQTEPAVAVPIFKKLLDAAQQQFLEMKFEPTYEGTIGQLTELEDEISRAFGILSHFNGVKNSPGVRSTLEQIQPEFIKLSLLMNQSVPKYEALEQLKKTNWETLDPVQQRIVDHELRSMKHAGIGFKADSAEKKRFNEISERLSYLSLTFGNNVLDATKAFKYVVKDKAELEGLSETFLKTLEKNAKNNGIEDGGYCITLDYPIYGPFMMNCKNRDLREKIYRANITKASEGKVNNEPIINEILSLKHEKANLLGYKTHADLSLSVKMAQTLPAAETLLDDLFTASLPHAKAELKELGQFAAETLNQPSPLQPWDIGYVTEQYRKKLFKYDEETIANYFSFPKVMKGLFEVADQVLGIQVQELTPEERQEKGITTWHPDVKVFQVSEKGNVKAYFYGDFYSRPAEKRSGAWMDIVTSRYKDTQGKVHLPVAYLICNQPPPQSDEDTPSLMKFRDVETLFHEFGHCLQHMMTTVDYAPASGVNGIEWDFVEVASQFMENFCNEPEWIDKLSGHYKTHERMPKDMVDALVKSKKFMAGLATLRQLHFSKTDLALHSTFSPEKGSVFDVEAEIAKDTVLTPRLPEDRFLCSFNHIFGGGYSAGYYSYKWSETYSADAYAAFEEAKEANGEQGIISMGQRYRDTVLALGGGTAPQKVWKEFRGRDHVDVKALLRHTGLN